MITDLIERVAKLTESDREVDLALLNMLGESYVWCTPLGMDGQREIAKQDLPDAHLEWMESIGEFPKIVKVPAYTASTDAAIALVDRVLPGVWWVFAKGKMTADEPLYAAQLLFGEDEEIGIGEGHTLPLAILAALLTALRAAEKQP